jgi:hypothetical protein
LPRPPRQSRHSASRPYTSSSATVLILQLFHPRDHGHVHATELGAPLVERRRADANLTAKVGNTFAASLRLSTAMIWLSVKRDFFIQNFLHIEKILPLTPLDFREDYPQAVSPLQMTCHQVNKIFEEQNGLLRG